ncbi:hypothetical protein NBRC116583_08650 [Arenicella sp. 4NH20-0111]|uniref:ABC-three component system middle component 5 n=1 Tax=Arenicella sp. 4NH20-0111 TaxID=3127648 RepID=UPI003109B834
MLIYHPFQDINHCAFRALLILEQSVHEEIDLDLYRLLDFYILFPHLLKEIKPLPIELVSYRKVIAKIYEPYESLRNTKRVLYELEPLQTTTLRNLIAKKFLDVESFRSRKLKRTDLALPKELNETIESSSLIGAEWFRMVINELPNISFLGGSGLKKRTGLMEFRYDLEVE